MRRGFLQQHGQSLILLLKIADGFAVLAAGLLAYLIKFNDIAAMPEQFRLIVVGMVASTLVAFHASEIYRPWRGAPIWSEIREVVFVWITLCAAALVLVYMTKTGSLISRIWFGLFFVLGIAFLTLVRVCVRNVLRHLRRRGFNQRNVLVIGAGTLGRSVVRHFRRNEWTGLHVIGYLDDDPDVKGAEFDGVPVLGDLDDISGLVSTDQGGSSRHPGTALSVQGELGMTEATPIHQVWLALPLTAEDRTQRVLHALDETSVDVHYVPDLLGYRLLNHGIDDIAGMPVINLSRSPIVGTAWLLKTLEDQLVAGLALLVFTPLMLLIAGTIKLISPGPVLYRQERMSWNGRRFTMLKFRTMPMGSEQHSGPVWASDTDGRATRFGSFLRRTSLDELPQLFNVLKGDMSVVGPRPERPYFVERFRTDIPAYMRKHAMKAGMTGWAQINGWRGNTSLEKRIEHDLFYIQNWSIWLDIKILVLTMFRGFNSKNAY